MSFADFFAKANQTRKPYNYQCRMAGGETADTDGCFTHGTMCDSRLINVPTGLGKTSAVIHAWLWNRYHLKSDEWPRRLVYCLPMRTLVEQTFAETKKWLEAHGILWDAGMNTHSGKVGLHMLMGGENSDKWELHPESDAILIGTQDMLLSRALNRGYGMSRFRWPMHYGLLNNDSLWVFDEVQLMGAGLPTTAQLAAFRENFGTEQPCKTWWMSATSRPDWLYTVDFKSESLSSPIVLESAPSEQIEKIYGAQKTLAFSSNSSTDAKKISTEVLATASTRGALTLVVVNTVKKAKDLYTEIIKQQVSASNPIRTILLHSQFRAVDRAAHLQDLLHAEKSELPVIAISTQIVEAGIDISARTLFTELAPWSSLVQRFGRCNRKGTEPDARIYIMHTDKAVPYHDTQFAEAWKLIDNLLADGANASPKNLSSLRIPDCDRPESKHVIRSRDFLDLFDTSSDLSGQDIDIDRWVREIDDTGIQFFWRSWEGAEKNQIPASLKDFSAPHRNELCPAPIGKETRDWLKKQKITPLRWDYLEAEWTPVSKEFGEFLLIPGQIYLLPSHAGGYSQSTGFQPDVTAKVAPVVFDSERSSEANESDEVAQGSWQSIEKHTDDVCRELDAILVNTGITIPELRISARWHDLGKAHLSFKAKFHAELANSSDALLHLPLAKAPKDAWKKNSKETENYRKHFRHELASALAVIHPAVTEIPEESKNLVAWLVAAHHGKVRLSIRSLPDETPPDDSSKRFARGVHDHDPLESVNLGAGVISPQLILSLEPMELGLCTEPPFAGKPSWTERMLALRDSPEIGPLRLAYWESLLRAADERASAKNS